MSLYDLGDDSADPANLPETVTLDARHQAFLEYEAPTGSELPDKVQQVIKALHEAFEAQKDLSEIHTMYEVTFKTLSEVYYKQRPWPTDQEIADLAPNSSLFLVLYKEMYFRHVHAIAGGSVSLEDRVGSFQNYYNLFSYIARVDPTELKFDLPNQWIWDLIDEYIYQFNDFARYRARMAKQNDEQAVFLREHGEIWNSSTVIDLLNQLVKRSDIAQLLEAPLKTAGATILPTSEIVEKNSSHLLRMLGYYSLVGLLRVHTLLGDYHSALRSVDIIDFGSARREKIYAKVVMCQVSLFFHTGFALLMTRRYADSAKFLTQLLSYIARVRGVHLRGYQVDDIAKKNDQVYQLLAVAHSLCPVRLEEGTVQMLKDKLGDKLNKLAQGDLETYGEVFRFAAPKFIPATINVDGDVGVFDATDLQKKRFLHEVRQQLVLPTIRSYLSLYSSITVSKLATFMTDKENNPLPPEQFRTFLLQLKHKSRQLVWQGGRITEGERMFCGSIDFYIQKDMVFVTNNGASKQRSSCAQFFFEQIQRLNSLDDLRFLPTTRPPGASGDERGPGRGRGRGRGRGGDRQDRDRQY